MGGCTRWARRKACQQRSLHHWRQPRCSRDDHSRSPGLDLPQRAPVSRPLRSRGQRNSLRPRLLRRRSPAFRPHHKRQLGPNRRRGLLKEKTCVKYASPRSSIAPGPCDSNTRRSAPWASATGGGPSSAWVRRSTSHRSWIASRRAIRRS